MNFGLVTREFNSSSTGKWDGTKNASRTGYRYNGTIRCLQRSPLMFHDVTEMLICEHSSAADWLREVFSHVPFLIPE